MGWRELVLCSQIIEAIVKMTSNRDRVRGDWSQDRRPRGSRTDGKCRATETWRVLRRN